MAMKIKGYEPREASKEVVTKDIWYDRQTRCWVTQYKDSEGNQVGEAEYTHQKPKTKKGRTGT